MESEFNNKNALYFSPLFRKVNGDILRPGDLESTKKLVLQCNWPIEAKIADVGCGAGATLNLLETLGYSPIGFDIDKKILAEAKEKTKARLIQADAQYLPLNNNELDGIVCECVLSLTKDIKLTLQEFYRVLKKGGFLILSDLCLDADKNSFSQAAEIEKCGINLAVNNSAILQEIGFTVLKVSECKSYIKTLAAKLLWESSCSCSEFKNYFGKKLSYAFWLAIKL